MKSSIQSRGAFPPAYHPIWDTIYVNAVVKLLSADRAYELACTAVNRLVEEDLSSQRGAPIDSPETASEAVAALQAGMAELLRKEREREAAAMAKASRPSKRKNGAGHVDG